MRIGRAVVVGLIWVGVLLASSPVSAQPTDPQAGRPYRGLFGSGIGSWDQSLWLRLGLGGGFDHQEITGDPLAQASATTSRNRSAADAVATLDYRVGRKRFGVSTGVTASGRYYPDTATSMVGGINANAAGWISVTSTSTLRLSTGDLYRPFDGLDLFPARPTISSVQNPLNAVAVGTPDLSTSPQTMHRANFDINMSHALSARSSISGGVFLDHSDVSGASRALTTLAVRGGYSHSIAKGLGINLGYGEQSARYPDTTGAMVTVLNRNINAGLDFNRTLSISRRTRLAFTSGTAAVSDGRSTTYRVTGTAHLTRELGRSWTTAVTYLRDVGFVGALRAPVFSDSVSIGLDGLFGRRLGFGAMAAAGGGSVGATKNLDHFAGYSASMGLTFALARDLGLSVTYAYYGHAFDSGAALPSDILRESRRQSLSASVGFLTPLLQRGRRPSATR